MLSRAVWRDGEQAEEEEDSSFFRNDDWYITATPPNAVNTAGSNLNHPFPDSSSLLLPPTVESFFSQKSFLSAVCSNQFDSSFDFSPENPTFFPPANSAATFNAGMLGFNGQDLMPMAGSSSSFINPMAFDSFENSPFSSRGKVLRPLEIFPPVGAQPNLFQKRAARQNSSFVGGILGMDGVGQGRGGIWDCEIEKRRRMNEDDEVDDGSIDGGSGLNYDSEDVCEVGENLRVDEEKNDGIGISGNVCFANSSLSGGGGGGGGEGKGRRKGLPAKNLMAERRRRKKLNDRLYMLRSVVPKISKVRTFVLED